ncbi:NAD(P)/FAD-dependent oxidoreductase [Profundibacter amoris]|uniref:Pyridine nucleotide-disulfide oxidoreductase n=1 Tax=Profundibacter amoris TaxID=2171755 RepID=A0A347UD43_9RHOB|nr:NAD(P)/FAD-dependent oxidoreductase [Profundibacter amoris]AXX96771.1 pyridine nucleotide-disulfide oxidoreductase [Profundibacter amoris]
MPHSDRRAFLKFLAAGSVMSSAGLAPNLGFGQSSPHVVIIGGGTGGATAAKYLKMGDETIRVTVIEANQIYRRCYGSNEVLTGYIDIEDIAITYDALQGKYGVEFIFDTVMEVDPQTRLITLKTGGKVTYDRLIVSPGIDFIWDGVEGYSEDVAQNAMPHSWKAGEQTLLLKRQIDAMPDNGTMIIVPPVNPYRCPPGPYERASLMSEMFQKIKPKAKILILDPKDGFAKDKPFMLGWNRLYDFQIPESKMDGMPEDINTYDQPGMIEWISGSAGGKVEAVDASAMTVTTEFGDTFHGDVINFIPAQKAAKLAFDMDLVDGNWCPINHLTMESTRHANIHVIGDSCVADVMPKSGYSANTQAKVVAAQILHLLREEEPEEPTWSNVCFSRVSSEYGVSVGGIYRLDHESGKIISTKGAGGVSPLDASHQFNRLEALYQEAWMENFVADSFG